MYNTYISLWTVCRTIKMETKTKNFILYNLDAPLVLHAFLKFSQIMIRINESTLEL